MKENLRRRLLVGDICRLAWIPDTKFMVTKTGRTDGDVIMIAQVDHPELGYMCIKYHQLNPNILYTDEKVALSADVRRICRLSARETYHMAGRRGDIGKVSTEISNAVYNMERRKQFDTK